MTMDFKSDLLAVQANSGDVNLCSLLLKKIANWNVSEASEDKRTVADLFYATLKAIQATENDRIIEKFYDDTISAFENISLIAKNGKENSSLILIDFLNELYQKTINEQITKIAQNHPAIVKTSSSEAPCWISR